MHCHQQCLVLRDIFVVVVVVDVFNSNCLLHCILLQYAHAIARARRKQRQNLKKKNKFSAPLCSLLSAINTGLFSLNRLFEVYCLSSIQTDNMSEVQATICFAFNAVIDLSKQRSLWLKMQFVVLEYFE